MARDGKDGDARGELSPVDVASARFLVGSGIQSVKPSRSQDILK